jgi:ABC-type spermidine/putrescine transport system permease subunit I
MFSFGPASGLFTGLLMLFMCRLGDGIIIQLTGGHGGLTPGMFIIHEELFITEIIAMHLHIE